VKKVADLNDEIAGASREQAGGIEQISKAINQLDQATQLNAASAEQAAATANELTTYSTNLETVVTKLEQVLEGAKPKPTDPFRSEEPLNRVALKSRRTRQTPSREPRVEFGSSSETESTAQSKVIPLKDRRKTQAPPTRNAQEKKRAMAEAIGRPREEELIPFGTDDEKESPPVENKFSDLSGF
jgi:methyl-accepting chemotaxis protein